VRVLLDEHLPVDLALDLAGHDVDTVVGRGSTGIKNGELLRRMSGHYDVLITMDRGIEFPQPISTFPFGVVIAHAASNRMTVPPSGYGCSERNSSIRQDTLDSSSARSVS
jgi:hypothetical protein